MFRGSDKALVFNTAITQLAIHLYSIFLRVRNLLIIDVDHNNVVVLSTQVSKEKVFKLFQTS